MSAFARTRVVAAAICLAAVAACERDRPEAAKTVRPVRTHTVTATDDALPRTFAGVARAGVESWLSFRVAGTVDSVSVDLGDSVARGRVLARLDPTDYELRVEEAEAALAQAEATLRRAEADYDRVRALYENNNSSKSELDAARAAAESGQAQVNAVKKQLEQARQQLGYSTLRAPVAGDIAEVDVEVNETVKSGDRVFLLTSGSQPEIEVAIPEVMIRNIEVGQRVTATFVAFPGRVFEAVVNEVGVAAVRGSTTFQVTARVENAEEQVRSGMAADVIFRFPNPEGGRIFVPPLAVGEDSEGRFVYVLERRGDDAAVVRRRGVEVGGLAPGGLEIARGLAAGEEVVTAGVRRLSDGLEVKPQA